jgi:hypothetical protein
MCSKCKLLLFGINLIRRHLKNFENKIDKLDLTNMQQRRKSLAIEEVKLWITMLLRKKR